jgi:hypothetical protein
MAIEYDQLGNVIGGSADNVEVPKSFTELKTDAQTNAGVKAPVSKTPQGKVYEPNKPRVTNVGDTALIGAPTISNLARGISDNTGIAVSDNNREHACDIAVYIQTTMAKTKVLAGDLVRAIRLAIRKIIDALGISPASSGMTEFLKDLARRIKEITRWINEKIVETAKYLEGIRKIRAIIEYILSLPAKLLAMFQKCLKEAYGELAKGLFSIASSLSVDTGTSELTDAAKEVINESKSLLQSTQAVLSIPAQAASALASPSGMSDAEKQALVLSLYPDSSGTNYDPTSFQATI